MLPPRRYLPSINLLTAFEAAARTESFTIAARELNLTQSAISRQVKALEEQLGAALFIREKQTVRLSDAGVEYARHIREALRVISTASVNLCANPDGGALHLAILPTFGTRWLASRLPQFIAESPNITVNLSTRTQPFSFEQDPIDAAIHFGIPNWENTDSLFIMEEEVIPVCAPDFKSRSNLKKAEDLKNVTLLHLESRLEAWRSWFTYYQVEDSNIPGMVFDQFSTAAQAAISGLGVALLPTFLFKEELDRGTLTPALDMPLKSAGGYYLIWPKDRSNYPPLRAFREWLQKEAHASPTQ
ncbi:MAG: LysR family transcriptional regulator [Sneathiella sp.]|nr:LysR family transcriptional regulator [Sneathiella sp.]